MKKAIIFIGPLLLLCISCEKASLRSDLEDKWDLLAISGGIHGSGMEINFDQLEFINNRKYEIERNDSIIENGEYTIYKSEEAWAGTYWRIEFDRNIIFEPKPRFIHEGAFMFYSSDTLGISEVGPDGFGWILKRK